MLSTWAEIKWYKSREENRENTVFFEIQWLPYKSNQNNYLTSLWCVDVILSTLFTAKYNEMKNQATGVESFFVFRFVTV